MNALLQNAVGPHIKLLRMLEARHMNYARLHKMQYRRGFIPLQGNVCYWDKIVAIILWLNDSTTKDGDVAVWLDNDSFWIDYMFPLWTALSEGYDIGLVEMALGCFNSGVLFVRANAKTRRMFDRIFQYSQGYKPEGWNVFALRDYGWYDQAALNFELSNPELDIKLHSMDSRFNHYAGIKRSPTDTVVVKSWHGMKMSCALKQMAAVARVMPNVIAPEQAGLGAIYHIPQEEKYNEHGPRVLGFRAPK